MATRDEEIICSASDETTTNNENLKRYLYIVYFYQRSLETKKKILNEGDVHILRSKRAHISVCVSYYTVYENQSVFGVEN